MTTEKCEFYNSCQVNCEATLENTECCECFRLHEHIEMLINAINQGTKKFDSKEAPFLHEAMSKHFEFSTGINLDDMLKGLD